MEARLDDVRADRKAHDLRLARLLPPLIDRFDGTRSPEDIRVCADAILTRYDEVPLRSFVLTLAQRAAVECLQKDVCDALPV